MARGITPCPLGTAQGANTHGASRSVRTQVPGSRRSPTRMSTISMSSRHAVSFQRPLPKLTAGCICLLQHTIRPRGPTDKASAHGAGDCRFQSCRGHAARALAGVLRRTNASAWRSALVHGAGASWGPGARQSAAGPVGPVGGASAAAPGEPARFPAWSTEPGIAGSSPAGVMQHVH